MAGGNCLGLWAGLGEQDRGGHPEVCVVTRVPILYCPRAGPGLHPSTDWALSTGPAQTASGGDG